MEAENIKFEYTAETRPLDILQMFIGVFADKGWLNQPVRVRHRERRYRVFCSESAFIAYRINDNCGISPGIPGWAVCIVDRDQIIEDSEMCSFASTEPSTHDWLHCIANGDYEVI